MATRGQRRNARAWYSEQRVLGDGISVKGRKGEWAKSAAYLCGLVQGATLPDAGHEGAVAHEMTRGLGRARRLWRVEGAAMAVAEHGGWSRCRCRAMAVRQRPGLQVRGGKISAPTLAGCAVEASQGRVWEDSGRLCPCSRVPVVGPRMHTGHVSAAA